MNKIIGILLSIAIISAYAAPPEIIRDEIKKTREECKKIHKELQSKMKEIRTKCQEERKKIHEAFKQEKEKCHKDYKGDIDAVRECIARNKQKVLNKIGELQSLTSRCFDERIATIDAYKDKIKECKALRNKKEEFKKQ